MSLQLFQQLYMDYAVLFSIALLTVDSISNFIISLFHLGVNMIPYIFKPTWYHKENKTLRSRKQRDITEWIYRVLL